MNIQGKVWGQTSQIFCKNNVEVNRIVGKAGGYCSKHRHAFKWNMFFVECGSLLISSWMPYGLVDVTVLKAGQSCQIPPQTPHKFEVLEDNTVAYEIYWTQLDSEDIVRETVGGAHDDR